LQYCEDVRLAGFHAIHRDTGGIPSELLALKISDLKIQTSPSTDKKYAEFWIGDKVGGKMRKARPTAISDAIPYYNAWISVHPRRDSPQGAYFFTSTENKAKYRNTPIKPGTLRQAYERTIEKHFPKLLTKPDVPLEDKAALESLIHDKPHFPYMRRHEFASENYHKLPTSAFNQLMGYSNSRMHEIYVHELGNEGNRELLIARVIIDKAETISPTQIQLQPKYCPICHESNKQDADFCFKCNWLSARRVCRKCVKRMKLLPERLMKKKRN
jgi:Phage integrase family